ncbi:hypothetical protein K490DRAFT_65570 [Saccharata proteae CBS 121410]|uniref:C2H2-type domain-containing protein n=1 Tax=Saccharata proteae CBS 121410 TaxID=1314787 RepID=A0A9P4HTI2_9PEZI|nr:hypothetical protein K490DRAFT_65570 [Saccharata proteae CBS 121410]
MAGPYSQDGEIPEATYALANCEIQLGYEDEEPGDVVEAEEDGDDEGEDEEEEDGQPSEDEMVSPESSTGSNEPDPRIREPDGAFLCQQANCKTKARFRRFADLQRHYKTVHRSSTTQMHDCPKKKCDRKGARGFTRRDHLTEHLRAYHNETIPKRRKGNPKT